MNLGALQGITVLDLTRVLAGPFCTMVLAELGARVIKVEAPPTGDDSREFGPFLKQASAYFLSLNRGKESLLLNLKALRKFCRKILDECIHRFLKRLGGFQIRQQHSAAVRGLRNYVCRD